MLPAPQFRSEVLRTFVERGAYYDCSAPEDLDALFKKYDLSVNVLSNDHIELKTEHGNYSTTGSKVILVFEDGRPTSLCSGTECEDHLKYFFKLKSLD